MSVCSLKFCNSLIEVFNSTNNDIPVPTTLLDVFQKSYSDTIRKKSINIYTTKMTQTIETYLSEKKLYNCHLVIMKEALDCFTNNKFIDKNDKEFEQYEAKARLNLINKIYQSYDENANQKYKVEVNQRTIDRVKNSFQ